MNRLHQSSVALLSGTTLLPPYCQGLSARVSIRISNPSGGKTIIIVGDRSLLFALSASVSWCSKLPVMMLPDEQASSLTGL